MFLPCPKCQSPVDVPDEPGSVVTCDFCQTVARSAGEKLVAVRQWTAAIEEEKPQPEAPPAPALPPAPPPAGGMGSRLPKEAWKSPPTPVAAPLFPPEAPSAPSVTIPERLRPLRRFALPAGIGAAVLVLVLVGVAAFRSGEEPRPAAAPSGSAPKRAADPEQDRRAALERAIGEAKRKLGEGGAFGEAEVPALAEILSREPSAETVEAASRALAGIGRPAASAIPALLAAPATGRLRLTVLDAAARIDPESSALKEALSKAIGGVAGEEDLRLEAVEICVRMGADGAVPLGVGLRSPDADLRDRAIRALVPLGQPALHVALSTLQWDTSAPAREAATRVIEQLDPPHLSEAPNLMRSLGEHEPANSAILGLIGRMGPQAAAALIEGAIAWPDSARKDWWAATQACLAGLGPKAVPVVREWLQEKRIDRPAVRELVAGAAGAWGPDAVPLLIPWLIDDSGDVRAAAVDSLGRLGPDAESAWEALQAGLVTNQLDERAVAAAVAVRGKGSVPLLTQLLEGAPEATRRAALKELGAFGRHAATAVPTILKLLLEDPLRAAAVETLVQVGDPAIPDLVAALGHNLPDVRCAAAAALAKIGPRATSICPALARLLADDIQTVREAAARALAAMGTDGVAELTKALKHKEPLPRALAVWALGLMGPSAAEALPALKATLAYDNETLRKSVIKTMARLGPKSVAELAALLKNSHPGIREWSADALGAMGPAASEALPALREAMSDDDPKVRTAVTEAIAKVEAK